VARFDPVGEVARWRTIYQLLRKVETDQILTYEAMGSELGLDPGKDRHTIQLAMRRAALEHERVDKRAVRAVPRQGYRVVRAPEHMELAERHQRKASRSIGRGRSKVDNVDLNLLDPETRRAFELVGRAFAMQQEMIRRLDVRHDRLEEAVNAVNQRVETDFAKVQERLAWLEEQERQRKNTSG